MDEEITILEATKQTGLHDSTIRRAIKNKKIEAHRLPDGQLRIPMSELDKLIHKDAYAPPMQMPMQNTEDAYAPPMQNTEDAYARLSIAEKRIETLEHEVASLRREINNLRETSGHTHHAAPPHPTPKPHATYEPKDSELPPGYIVLRQFNELHTMSHTSIGRWINNGKIEITRNEQGWKVGRTFPKEALSPQQQHTYWLKLHHLTAFKECEHCPHNPDTTQPEKSFV